MTAWDTTRLNLLRDYAGKYSASEIANRINKESGSTFTRNAIVGQMHRSGLKGRPPSSFNATPRMKRVRRSSFRPRSYAASEQPTLIPMPVESLNIPFLMTGPLHCRFITSTDLSDALCCGHTTDGGSYCVWHRSIVTEPRRGSRVVSFRNRRMHYAPEQGRPGLSAQG
jgi:hypothetical protein